MEEQSIRPYSVCCRLTRIPRPDLLVAWVGLEAIALGDAAKSLGRHFVGQPA